MKVDNNTLFLNHQVADLVWAISSPPLMNFVNRQAGISVLKAEWFTNHYNLHAAWLKELDLNADLLNNWIERYPQKLVGKYFEALLHFWFVESDYFELLAHNLQLTQMDLTIGEVDFLVRELETGKVLHIETACKYYLGYKNSASLTNWVGPNGVDTLQKKMQTTKRQLQIFDSYAGKSYLAAINMQKPESVLWMKGYFFHHLSRLSKSRKPIDAFQNYQAGWYLFHKEISALSDSDTHWVILPKKYWISPLCCPQHELETHGESKLSKRLTHEIERTGKAQLVAQISIEDGILREKSRGFVVPDSWPNSQQKIRM